MNGIFILYEILILLKIKNMNVCCFQIITNQLTMIIHFNDTDNTKKKKFLFF